MTGIGTDPIWQQIKQTGFIEGRRIHCFETVESTNSLALAMGQAGVESGTVLVAETQTKGRGRLGKSWESPRGVGLYCTVLLRPALPIQHLARITLAAGLAAALAIDEVSGEVSSIKWPNDVLIRGQKVAGILAECHMSGEGGGLVALGIGINLETSFDQFPPELRAKATSLVIASGKAIGKGLMLVTLLRWIDTMIFRLEQREFAEILDEWRAKDATAHKKLTWLTPDGRAVYGLSLGPDQEGLLVIRDEAGHCHHVLSGELNLASNRLNGYAP